MNRIVSANCPRCGAQLQPAPGSDQATCQYCGTTSFVQRHHPVAAPLAPASRKGNPALLLAALGLATAVFLGAIVAVVALARGGASAGVSAPSSFSNAPVAEAPAAAGVVAAESIRAPAIEILEDFTPLVADLDSDGTADVVAAIASIDADRSQHYAAFSGRDGHELSRTPALTDRNGAVAAVVGRRLVSASRAGQLTSYGLADGSQQWTTALGARATAFCGAKNSETLVVATDERRQLAIDLTTGRQSPTKEPCTLPITRGGNDDPRDRHDYDAPQGTESYRCGGVTVMGSANYTVPDQCLVRAHIDTDRLDGFIGHRLWKIEQNWLAFGIRQPGARVPMVALISRGKLAWKAALPLDNPLQAQEGSPRFAGLATGSIVAVYVSDKDRRPFVTAFSVADGTRRWHVALPEGTKNISSLATSPNRVFIRAEKQLVLLDASNGQLVARLGRES